MTPFTVVWHYIGNHGVIRLRASNASVAIQHVREAFSPDFREKAALFVFHGEPVMVFIPNTYPETAKISDWGRA